jgi:hypothetical protein
MAASARGRKQRRAYAEDPRVTDGQSEVQACQEGRQIECKPQACGRPPTGRIRARAPQIWSAEVDASCRFSEGWDPSFSKPFPPELFPHLNASSVSYQPVGSVAPPRET